MDHVISQILCYFLLMFGCNASAGSDSYLAAVVEYESLPPASSALQTMLNNAAQYDKYAKEASNQKVDLIVFPEYGLMGLGVNMTLDEWDQKVKEFPIYLPENTTDWIPCDDHASAKGSENYEVLQNLSCIAKDNSIVLVVNVMTKEPCEQRCPAVAGVYTNHTFNTNLIFGKDGTLLARYHKRHLFREPGITAAPTPEVVIVDVGFVKFGIFTCWDIMFADPATNYVLQHGVQNLVFSTAWGNEFPFISSMQIFSRFARGMGVNLIASNAYNPWESRLGSGIYSSTLGALNETYDLATPGRLIVAEVPVTPTSIPSEDLDCNLSSNHNVSSSSNSSNFVLNFHTDIPSSRPIDKIHKVWYYSLRNLSRSFLRKPSGNEILCEGDLCCRLEYEIENYDDDDDLYVFAIRNGFHSFGDDYQVYVQVCSVLRCETEDIETCGRVLKKPTLARFEQMDLSGSFQTTILLPSILSSDLTSVANNEWTFTKGKCSPSDSPNASVAAGKISIDAKLSKPMMVASIYGRIYDRD